MKHYFGPRRFGISHDCLYKFNLFHRLNCWHAFSSFRYRNNDFSYLSRTNHNLILEPWGTNLIIYFNQHSLSHHIYNLLVWCLLDSSGEDPHHSWDTHPIINTCNTNYAFHPSNSLFIISTLLMKVRSKNRKITDTYL